MPKILSPPRRFERPFDLLGWCSLGVLLVSFWLEPQQGLSFLRCLFRDWTGWPCPACGLTRATASLSHGLVSDAIALNPFALPLYLWFWWRALGLFLPGLRQQCLQWCSQATLRLWLAGFWGMWVVYGVVRTVLVAWTERMG